MTEIISPILFTKTPPLFSKINHKKKYFVIQILVSTSTFSLVFPNARHFGTGTIRHQDTFTCVFFFDFSYITSNNDICFLDISTEIISPILFAPTFFQNKS